MCGKQNICSPETKSTINGTVKKIFLKKVLTNRVKCAIIISESKGKGTLKMFKVMMIVDNETYKYGAYADRDRANEIAMQVSNDRQIETYVEQE